jgi:hypothetical protein
VKTVGQCAVVGAALRAIVEAWHDKPIQQSLAQEFSLMGKRMVTTSAVFAGLGGTFYLTRYGIGELRARDDYWNQTVAGAVTGGGLGYYRK